jgi:hypothetical protein
VESEEYTQARAHAHAHAQAQCVQSVNFLRKMAYFQIAHAALLNTAATKTIISNPAVRGQHIVRHCIEVCAAVKICHFSFVIKSRTELSSLHLKYARLYLHRTLKPKYHLHTNNLQ